MSADKVIRLTVEYVHSFEKVEAQMVGFFEEVGNLAKKKPDDAVNLFKLGFINQSLAKANKLLGDNYRPYSDFDSFDTTSIPSNSDVTTILSQYLKSMDLFRKEYTSKNPYDIYHHWNIPNYNGKIFAKTPNI